jgi:hypothetical protein
LVKRDPNICSGVQCFLHEGGICQVLADTIFSADMVLIEKRNTVNPQGQMSIFI